MKTITQLRPAQIQHSWAWLMLSLLTGISFVAFSQPVLAQTGSDLQTPVGSSDRDANTNGDLNSINSMFDLLHRAQIGAIRDPYDFNRDQQQTINSQASTFRQRQAELLRQQEQAPVTPQIVAPTYSQPR